jgi:hypothetical protein
MSNKRTAENLTKALAVLSTAGVLLATTCTSEQLQAVVVGIEAAARELNEQDHDDDMSFGDWLVRELDAL